MAKTVIQIVAAALLASSVLAPAHGGVVSLVDVTGTTPQPQVLQQAPPLSYNFVGYPDPPVASAGRPGHQGGVVSLTDVTGLTPEQHAAFGNAYTGPPRPAYLGGTVNLADVNGVAQRPPRPGQGGVVSLTHVTGVAPQYLSQPAHAQALHPEQGYDPQRPYSPCYVPGSGPAAYAGPAAPQHYPVNAAHLRLKRSPKPGVVRLEDVAGPGAGRYPSFGPPAYVQPYNHYNHYNNYWYSRPRPYYNVFPVPCFGLFCL